MGIECTLIITGVQEEADAFLPGQGRMEQAGPLAVRVIEYMGKRAVLACSGIGKVNAAFAAGLLIERFMPDLLMVIGTAGKIGTAPGDCFWIAEAIQHDYGAQEASGFVRYTAGDWPIGPAVFAPFRAIDAAPPGLPRARMATGDSFVACPKASQALVQETGAMLVDMETAAVAQVATASGLPWAAIKATTDDANGESAGDFQANLKAAAARAARAAEAFLGVA